MKIGINCGHTVSGTIGCGAVGRIDESVEARTVGRLLMVLLRKAGHTVYDCTNDYAPSVSSNLAQIIDMANRQPLDLFVSVHFNSGGGQGTEVFTYGGKSFTEAENVCRSIAKIGFKNRGIKDGSHLYVVRRSNAKAMLIEVCFVDTDDAQKYKDIGAERVAMAICEGITGQKTESEDELMSKEYDELKKENAELKAQIQALQPMVYDYMDKNMPSWAKPTIQKLMDRGSIVGDENGKLGLTMDFIRMLVTNDREGLYN